MRFGEEIQQNLLRRLIFNMENIEEIVFTTHFDKRGSLTSIEELLNIPIKIKRIFYMHHIMADRGGHAHRDTDQVLIPIHGSFKLQLENGFEKQIFDMNDPTKGIYIPRMIYTTMYDFSDDAVCLVLANTNYDINMSIRTWDEFIEEIDKNPIKDYV